jgi:hypothetical protein
LERETDAEPELAEAAGERETDDPVTITGATAEAAAVALECVADEEALCPADTEVDAEDEAFCGCC